MKHFNLCILREILVLFFISFLPLHIGAQELRLGVKVGNNATFLIGNETTASFADRFERGNGYQLGIEASYMFYQTIGLLVESSFQNNAFDITQEKIVDVLPNGNTAVDALVSEQIQVKNGSLRFGLSFLFDFDRFDISVGSNFGLLTSSKGDVLRVYQDSLSGSTSEELDYDFLQDASGEEGAYWDQTVDQEPLFDRLQFAGNLAFRMDLLGRSGLEVKSNYGFGDIVNDLTRSGGATFGRQLDLLLSLKYSFPIKRKKDKTDIEKVDDGDLPKFE